MQGQGSPAQLQGLRQEWGRVQGWVWVCPCRLGTPWMLGGAMALAERALRSAQALKRTPTPSPTCSKARHWCMACMAGAVSDSRTAYLTAWGRRGWLRAVSATWPVPLECQGRALPPTVARAVWWLGPPAPSLPGTKARRVAVLGVEVDVVEAGSRCLGMRRLGPSALRETW